MESVYRLLSKDVHSRPDRHHSVNRNRLFVGNGDCSHSCVGAVCEHQSVKADLPLLYLDLSWYATARPIVYCVFWVMEDLKGKKTANTISSTYASQAEAYGATVTGVDDLNQTIELLLSKRIDATLNAEVVFNDYKKEHPEADVKIATYSDQVEEIAIPIRKGDDTVTLLEAVNDALDEMAKDGTLTELSEKYFGMDISKK